jgi:hypothetical protein
MSAPVRPAVRLAPVLHLAHAVGARALRLAPSPDGVPDRLDTPIAMAALRSGRCSVCRQRFPRGEAVIWRRNIGCACLDCARHTSAWGCS